jgi:ribonucleoside-diphosphate reductase alpha chain
VLLNDLEQYVYDHMTTEDIPLTDHARSVLEKRYLKVDELGPIETPKDMLVRVAAAVATADELYGEDPKPAALEFYELMAQLKFLPNSPTLRGAGRGTMLSACSVLPIEDSRESIFNTLRDAVTLSAHGVGIGYNFSKLRAKDSPIVTTGGKASGPISFMKVYDLTLGEVISQGGTRAAASISIIRYDHPDILEFVTCKQDGTSLRNFNISVGVTEEFMKIASEGKDFDLIDHNGLPVGTMNAGELLQRIAECAWATGDPGLIFLDRIDRDNPTPHIAKCISTNPSLTGDTLVLSSLGILPIRELEGKKFLVSNIHGDLSAAECFKSGSNCKVYEVTLGTGVTYKATAEHKWPVTDNSGNITKVNTSELVEGMWLPFGHCRELPYGTEGTYNDGFLIGWNYGDGSIVDRSEYNQYNFVFGEEDILSGIYDKIRNILKDITCRWVDPARRNRGGKDWIEINVRDRRINDIFVKFGCGRKSEGLPAGIWNIASEDFRRGFIDGLFSADGYVGKEDRRLILTTSRVEIARDISNLLGFYGIKSSITHSAQSSASFPNGKDYGKVYHRYDLNITGMNVSNFSSVFRLSHVRKQELLNAPLKLKHYPLGSDSIKVIEVKELTDREDVWDISVYDNTHTFKLSQCVTGNCGEVPLLDWELCNLGSINLLKFVSDQKILWDNLGEVVRVAVHFLDNVIDANKYPLDKVEAMAKGNRKIGLGVMGWADMLSLLRVPYGSDAAVKLANEVMGFINAEAKKTSVSIATKRGTFPNFPGSIYDTGKEADRVRNASWTVIAPGGTIGLIANCNGGIEPYFMLAYERGSVYNKEGKPTITSIIRCDTLDTILKEEGVEISKEGLEKIVETGSLVGVKDVPKHIAKVFPTAHEVTPAWHLKVQSAFQSNTTSSISKTCNLVHSATVKDVLAAYQLAYKLGNIKGMTVYRDGCKADQVMQCVGTQDKPGDIPKAPLMTNGSRPKKLYGFTEKVETPVGTLYMVMNMDDTGTPVEVFLNIGKAGSDLLADGEAIGRLLTLLLQYHIPIEDIVHQLKGIGGSSSIGLGRNRIKSLPDAVSRVLEATFTKVEGEVKEEPRVEGRRTGNVCPECGNMLVEAEGCTKCNSCGYSKC